MNANAVRLACRKKSCVKISQIRTMSVERLSRKTGRAKPEEVELVITGLNQIVAP